ncbi:phosphatase PAP2 family protein [Hoyosella rhizosphaerae]|uniref:Phosphoesterase n=1 Tax=Hoyosella rhizosphaerae TaxID=1755582 RepID=A0A916U8U0_9ACTN|nr:phosphatase PAP2 family protein [Hoyosella rhizosphaerae]MBN4927394.1 phosphatase PAP2 family protein [Hoyosella rhizosphaerae]GGC64751.1 putative phosphoesterase [Hoyosella rhizosphaerae]
MTFNDAVPRSYGPPQGEEAILVAVQHAIADKPGVLATTRLMSHFGEHALGWVAVAGIGALLDAPQRRRWGAVAIGAVGAHAASIAIKRVVRRRRPHHPDIVVNVSTPSQLSFPSSHATSSTAAAILIGRLTGLPIAAAVVPPMLLSRLVLGVHYPSDVLTGAAVGAASAAAVALTEQKLGWA